MSTVGTPNTVPIPFETARTKRCARGNATDVRLETGNEHLGYGIPPVVDAGGDVANAVHAPVDVNVPLSWAVLQVAGVRVACGAGDVSAKLVVGFRTCRDSGYNQIAVKYVKRDVGGDISRLTPLLR